MSKVLLISCNVIDFNISGPSIRYLEIARYLSRFHKVTLAIPNQTVFRADGFEIVTYTAPILQKLVKEFDVVIIQGIILERFPFLKDISRPLVIDLYPYMLEWLEVDGVSKEELYLYSNRLKGIITQLSAGDFFICTHERLRNFWLGMLCAVGRVNPINYQSDRNFEELVALVPFGLPTEEIKHTNKVLKGIHKDISENDKIILWWGGIWDWFDPITLLKAMNLIQPKRKDIKLCFIGTGDPNPSVPPMKMSVRAIEVSKKLGLFNKSVFFMDWVPYQERSNYLSESDIGLSINQNHIESRFSFRTRILDYIWANLPIIATDAGAFSELIRDYQLGITIGAGDVNALAKSILELLDDAQLYRRCKENLRNIATKFRWEEILTPLNEFCVNPRVAPDKKWYLKQQRSELFSDKIKTKKINYYFHRLKDLCRRQGIAYTIKYSLRKVNGYKCKTI